MEGRLRGGCRGRSVNTDAIRAMIAEDVAVADANAELFPYRPRPTKTCMGVWFPRLEKLGVLVPETKLVKGPLDLAKLCDGQEPTGWHDFVLAILDAASEVVGVGQRFFLRTGYTSGKHYWRESCDVQTWGDIGKHISEIVNFSAFVGLPDNLWAVREMLSTQAPFVAFSGRMPVTCEWRYFIDKGEIVHRQPYWPADAIKGQKPSDEYWEDELKALYANSDEDHAALEPLTLHVAQEFKGYWSVDWLKVGNDWYLIDMAEGEKSHKWDPEGKS